MRYVTRSGFVFACLLLLAAPAHSANRVEDAGSALRLAMPAAALGMAWSRDDAEGQSQLFWNLGTTVAATYAFKYAIDDEAPNGKERSSVSGHASVAFASAAFLQRRYGWRYGLPAYAAATFVGWSRLHADEHHDYQVIGGTLIGLASGYFWTTPIAEEVALTPWMQPGQLGVSLSATW